MLEQRSCVDEATDPAAAGGSRLTKNQKTAIRVVSTVVGGLPGLGISYFMTKDKKPVDEQK